MKKWIKEEIKNSYLIEGIDYIPNDEYDLISSFIDKEERITLKELMDLNNILNKNKDKSLRYHDDFGIYEDGKLIYKPSINKEEIDIQMDKFIKTLDKFWFIEDVETHFNIHILFEKIHPFIDGNGRIGRAILSRCLKAPVSIYLNLHKKNYFKSLDEEIKMKGIVEWINENDYQYEF